MFYLDASTVVAAIAEETNSERIWAWLGNHWETGISVSPWVGTEVASALAIKLRTGDLSLQQRASAANRWRQLLDDSLATIPISQADFEAAEAICERHDLGIRAGDGLHLAIARAHGCTLVTLDTVMARAAPQLGVLLAEL